MINGALCLNRVLGPGLVRGSKLVAVVVVAVDMLLRIQQTQPRRSTISINEPFFCVVAQPDTRNTQRRRRRTAISGDEIKKGSLLGTRQKRSGRFESHCCHPTRKR